MKKKITFAGSIILDIVKIIELWPDKGMLVTITNEEKAVGGCVCNTAVDLKLMDANVEVSACGRIGDDGYGEWVLNFMKSKGLDVSGVKKAKNLPTSYTDVMTLKTTGERTFFHARGANATFQIEDVDVDKLDCDIFHLGYLLALDGIDAEDKEYGTKAAKLLCQVQNKGIKTSIDMVSDQNGRFTKIIPPSLKYCDYLIINEIEGGMIAEILPRTESGVLNIENLREICKKLLGMGVKDSVVLHAPELSVAMDGKGNFTVVPSLDLPKGYIVGSVGAGDAFCAGMLYSHLMGYDLEKGMKIASLSAACNLSSVNSVGGARSIEEILKLENQLTRRNI